MQTWKTALLVAAAIFQTPGWASNSTSETSYSAIASLGSKAVYLGVKHQKRVTEILSSVEIWDCSTRMSRLLELPIEIRSREIIALLPSLEGLLLMSQRTVEGGDAPQAHFLNFKNKRWLTLGSLDCPLPKKIITGDHQLTLSCEYEASEEKVQHSEKTLQLPRDQKFLRTTSTLPQANDKEGELLVNVYHWHSARIHCQNLKDVIEVPQTLESAQYRFRVSDTKRLSPRPTPSASPKEP